MLKDRALVKWTSVQDDPLVDLARGKLLLERASSGGCVFSWAVWPKSALVLGYGQEATGAYNEAFCRASSVSVLRRRTGGSGVLVDGDMVLSLAIPSAIPAAKTIGRTYDLFVDSTREALLRLGLETHRWKAEGCASRERSKICFENQLTESLLIDGKKVMGCSQTRVAGAVLIHAVLMLGLDVEKQAGVFGVDRQRIEKALSYVSRCDLSPMELLPETLSEVIGEKLNLEVGGWEEPPVLPERLTEESHGPKWKII